jgi:hypothetical protein
MRSGGGGAGFAHAGELPATAEENGRRLLVMDLNANASHLQCLS